MGDKRAVTGGEAPPKIEDPELHAVVANAFKALGKDIVIMLTVDENDRLSLEWRAKNARIPMAKQVIGKMFADFFEDDTVKEVRLPTDIPDA